jgi:hypothetical protein
MISRIFQSWVIVTTMTNEQILAEVVKVFEPHYKEDTIKTAQEFVRTHAQIWGLSPEEPLAPIAEHLLLAAEKMVEPSLSTTPIANYRLYEQNKLF